MQSDICAKIILISICLTYISSFNWTYSNSNSLYIYITFRIGIEDVEHFEMYFAIGIENVEFV